MQCTVGECVQCSVYNYTVNIVASWGEASKSWDAGQFRISPPTHPSPPHPLPPLILTALEHPQESAVSLWANNAPWWIGPLCQYSCLSLSPIIEPYPLSCQFSLLCLNAIIFFFSLFHFMSLWFGGKLLWGIEHWSSHKPASHSHWATSLAPYKCLCFYNRYLNII